MVKVKTIYKGNLEVELIHEPSGAKITTTAPKDNEGTGTAFSPTDLIAGAVGACMLTMMGIYAKKENFDIVGATIDIEKNMTTIGARRLDSLTIIIDLPSSLPDLHRKKIENWAMACPAKKSLHPDIKIEVQFNYI